MTKTTGDDGLTPGKLQPRSSVITRHDS